MRISEVIVIDGKSYPVEREMTAEEKAAFVSEQKTEETPPTFEERIEAQVVYTAMMTDTLLEI